MNSIIILISLGIILNIAAQNPPQHSVQGRILDAESGSPLADVNIFLANTMLGASSDKNGQFIIERIPMILEFERNDTNVLFATAREPLIIENRALGYKITYLLETFEADADYTRYSGEPKFEELIPENPEQQKEWEINCRRAYFGSFHHFLTTICQNYELTGGNTKDRDFKIDTSGAIANGNTVSFRIDYKDKSMLEHEGFRVLQILNPWVANPKGRLVNTNKFLRPGGHPNERFLKFPDYLEITYNKELEEDNFLHHTLFYRRPDIQRPWINLLTDSVTIDIHSCYYDKFLV